MQTIAYGKCEMRFKDVSKLQNLINSKSRLFNISKNSTGNRLMLCSMFLQANRP